jgi:hypothetical protein
LEILERSLRNLRTDYVDLYLAHEPNEQNLVFSDELVRELQRIRESGKARFIGVAGNAAHCLALASQHPNLADIIQVQGESLGTAVASAEQCRDRRITFGYFREALRNATPLHRPAAIRSRAQVAALDNPGGVILFSARSTARIDEMVSVFGLIEGAAPA